MTWDNTQELILLEERIVVMQRQFVFCLMSAFIVSGLGLIVWLQGLSSPYLMLVGFGLLLITTASRLTALIKRYQASPSLIENKSLDQSVHYNRR